MCSVFVKHFGSGDSAICPIWRDGWINGECEDANELNEYCEEKRGRIGLFGAITLRGRATSRASDRSRREFQNRIRINIPANGGGTMNRRVEAGLSGTRAERKMRGQRLMEAQGE
jgi:hypothetical protein